VESEHLLEHDTSNDETTAEPQDRKLASVGRFVGCGLRDSEEGGGLVDGEGQPACGQW
jgi:hypothetical protein